MYTEVLRGCDKQILYSQITFPLLPLLIQACIWLVSSSLFHRIFSLGFQHFPGTMKFFILEDIEGQLSLRWPCMLFWKLEILPDSYSLPFSLWTSLKNLPRSLYSAAQIYPNQNIRVIRVSSIRVYAYWYTHIRVFVYAHTRIYYIRVCLISMYELTYWFFFC